MTLDNYTFPKERMKTRLDNPNKTPLVLVSCGSFSPPTNLHLRMFEEAADYCQFETEFEVVGGFFSPVGDAYKKAGLASAHHRINMTRIAVQDSSQWIGVDPWEPLHKEYLPTVKVLDHFDYELNEVLGGIQVDGEKRHIHVALLAGADLIQTMSTPGTSLSHWRCNSMTDHMQASGRAKILTGFWDTTVPSSWSAAEQISVRRTMYNEKKHILTLFR